MNELALFAGGGGGILGGLLLGWRTVCAVERDPYAASVLLARQNDGVLAPFPIWDDVCTFDGRPWRGRVDVVSGGFPCQDISVAGKGAGIDGERSGLWGEMARIIGEVRPRFAFVENSPALVTRGLGRVLGDLAALGYNCRWTVLGAADVGAPHKRDRFWLVASDTDCDRCDQVRERFSSAGCTPRASQDLADEGEPNMADTARHEQRRPQQRPEWQRAWPGGESIAAVRDTNGTRLAQRQSERSDARSKLPAAERADWWKSEPDVGRVAHGVAARVDRLKALGNGQVPQCAAEAWRLLTHNAVLSCRGQAVCQ